MLTHGQQSQPCLVTKITQFKKKTGNSGALQRKYCAPPVQG